MQVRRGSRTISGLKQGSPARPGRFTSREETWVCIEQEARRVPEPVLTFRRVKKRTQYQGNHTKHTNIGNLDNKGNHGKVSNQSGYKYTHASIQSAYYFCPILTKRPFYRQALVLPLRPHNIKSNENSPTGSSCSMQTTNRTDRHNEAKSRCSQLCDRSERMNISWIQRYSSSSLGFAMLRHEKAAGSGHGVCYGAFATSVCW
jgi:hypothetical protein